MAETSFHPTAAQDPDDSWTVESLALSEDNDGTQCTGDGWLVLKAMSGPSGIPVDNLVVGIALLLRGKCPEVESQLDSMTDSAGAYLNAHDGEQNCDWQKPAASAHQRINASGRSYYRFENDLGPSNARADHYTPGFDPGANCAVEAVFHSASVVGDKGEIYLRSNQSGTHYALEYSQSTSTWRILKRAAWVETVLASEDSPSPIGVGQSMTGRLEAVGTHLRAIVAGSVLMTASDPDLASGHCGLALVPGISSNGGTRPDLSVVGAEEGGPPPPGPGGGGPGGSIPDAPDVGLQIDRFSTFEAGADTVEVGLSADGVAPTGQTKTLLLSPSLNDHELGGFTDDWSHAWEPGELQSTDFSVMVRRTRTSVGPQIDSVRGMIYHTGSGGTFEMGFRETTRQRIQFGFESTYGTAGTVNKRMRDAFLQPQTNAEFRSHRPAGEKLESEQMLVRESSVLSLSGIPCYNQLGYFLKMMNGSPVTSGTSGERMSHFFRFENRGEQKGVSATIEYGEDPTTIDVFGSSTTFNRGSRVKAATIAQLGMELSRNGEASISGSMFAHKIELDHVMSAGSNDVQTITITATGGSMKVRFNGSAWATVNLPPANAAALETALNAIATIGADGVAVTGTGPYVVTFDGTSFAGKPQPLIEIDPTSATGGSVTIAHTTVGGVTEYPIVPVLPEHLHVYIADSYASLSSNRMQRCKVASFSVSDRFSPFWAFNRSNGGNFLDRAEGTGVMGTIGLRAHADSEVTALLGKARSNAKKFIRIEAVGPTAYGSDNHELVIDACVKVKAVGELGDEEGMYFAAYELGLVEDRSWGQSLTVWLRNLMENYN